MPRRDPGRALIGAPLALTMFFASLAPALAESPADRLEAGRFTRQGVYEPPESRAKFYKLHRKEMVPRYPVVLVHGVGGFDRVRLGKVAYADYFNGAAKRLRREGVTVYTTKTDQFGPTQKRAEELKQQLLEIGEEKYNLVCHSMGGLDARWMVTHLGMADRVASITTVGTPHHGSWYADWVIEWVFEKQRFWKVWEWLGLSKEAIPRLTVKYMEETFNPMTPDVPEVRYFSLGGHQHVARTLLPWKLAQVIITILEKRAVGKKLSFFQRATERAVMPKALRKRLRKGARVAQATLGVNTDWVRPEVAGLNDSKVTISSATWGEYLGSLDADHWDQPGWGLSYFDAPRFYSNVAKMLADVGY